MPSATPQRNLIEGHAAWIIIEIQASCYVDKPVEGRRAIPHMPDHAERILKSRAVIDSARERDIPAIFIQ